MAYWLFKTEADAWSWDEQKKKGAAGEEWTGVRNFQARGNMRKMKKGDRGFFYHTGDEKQVVGIVEVIKEAHPESKDAGVGERRPESRRRRAEAGDARRDQGRAEAEGDGAGQELAPLGAAGQRRRMGARLQDGRRRSRKASLVGISQLVPDLRRQSASPPDALRQLGDHRRAAFSSISCKLGLGVDGEQRAVLSLGMIPARLFGYGELPPDLVVVPAWATILTSMFMHGGLLHLAGNMLYLWIFGDNIEDSMGHVRFLVFYLLCGTAAALAQGLIDPASEIPMIGASGAISGVLGGYILLHPAATIRVFIFLGFFVTVARVPAWIVLGVWFLLQLVSRRRSVPPVRAWRRVHGACRRLRRRLRADLALQAARNSDPRAAAAASRFRSSAGEGRGARSMSLAPQAKRTFLQHAVAFLPTSGHVNCATLENGRSIHT